MENRKVKQVLILRKDLNMRKGKIASQAAHASLMAYQMHLDSIMHLDSVLKNKISLQPGEELLTAQEVLQAENAASAFNKWNDPKNEYRKITVSVNSEQELLAIAFKAGNLGLITSLVKDLGLTEFKEQTYTAVAIGPHWDDEIDPITAGLTLL